MTILPCVKYDSFGRSLRLKSSRSHVFQQRRPCSRRVRECARQGCCFVGVNSVWIVDDGDSSNSNMPFIGRFYTLSTVYGVLRNSE